MESSHTTDDLLIRWQPSFTFVQMFEKEKKREISIVWIELDFMLKLE